MQLRLPRNILPSRSFLPACRTRVPRAAVLSHLVSRLGMPVYAYDAHGHGRSGPLGAADGGYSDRALIRSFDHMVGDLIDFTRQVGAHVRTCTGLVGLGTWAGNVGWGAGAGAGGRGRGRGRGRGEGWG